MGGRSFCRPFLPAFHCEVPTNLPMKTMNGAEVVAAYHDLWQVEHSFRMVKSDLRARPIFHHKHDAIEAHLTVVSAALAVSRPPIGH